MDDCVLDEGFRSHKLIIGGIVNDIHDSCFSGALFRAPAVITLVKGQSSVLVVSTSSTNCSDFFGAQMSSSVLSSHLKLSLLLMDWHSSSCGSSLVA